MENSIDLSLRSLHGIGWLPGDERTYTTPLSGIKAYVSFSGSLPNMKVSSFAMCFETGNLVIESNTPKLIDTNVEESEAESEKSQSLDIKFADPFKKLSSNLSSTSESSNSSHQPHLQFPLGETEAKCENDESDSQQQKFLKFKIVFRSMDDGAIAEAEATMEIPERDFEGLPLDLDVPIVNTTSTKLAEADKSKHIVFEESAFIRVHLQGSSKQYGQYSPPNPDFNEIFPSDNVDESLLRGMVNKIHEQDCLQKGNLDLTKSSLFGADNKNPEGRRSWAFSCGGAIDLKHLVKSFYAGVGGFGTKCADTQDVPELLSSPTMESTIITRESLLI